MSDAPNSKKLSFEEFKLYYESAEKVTDRRLETNRWNHSICVAVLIAVAVIVKWSVSDSSLIRIGFAAADVLCLMAAFFSILWLKQIDDFKYLNKAKFEVLGEMAPRVEFNLEKPGEMVSYDPFAKEWIKLQQSKSLATFGKPIITALRSSGTEYFIPKAFRAVFAGLFVLLTLAIILGWHPTPAVPSAPPAVTGVTVLGGKP